MRILLKISLRIKKTKEPTVESSAVVLRNMKVLVKIRGARGKQQAHPIFMHIHGRYLWLILAMSSRRKN